MLSTRIGVGFKISRSLLNKKFLLLSAFGNTQNNGLSTSENYRSVRAKGTYKGPSLNLGGIYPPIATPFQENEDISYDKLEKNFEKWNTVPLAGYLVEGSNGEYVFLTSEERIKLIAKAKQFAANGKLIIGGSGCESTRETIYMSNKMAEAGADAVMVLTPSFFKSGMKDSALRYHYEAVADRSPVPVILYNAPAFTGVELSVDAIVSLAKHKNIIGLKDSGGDITKIGNVLHRTKHEDFQVLAGSAGFLLASLHLGCVGGVCALANVLGPEVCEVYRLFVEGDAAGAAELQKQLIGPNAAVTKIYGVPGLKEMMDAKGYFGGKPRSPLRSLSSDEAKAIRQLFSSAGYL